MTGPAVSYQPRLFDYIESPDTFTNLCERFGSFYTGGNLYKVARLEGGGFTRIYDNRPLAKNREIVLNILKIAVFPLTLVALIFKAYHRNLPDKTIPSNPIAFPPAPPLDHPSDSDDDVEPLQASNQQHRDPLRVSRELFQQLDLGNRPSVTFLEIAKDSIKLVEDNHLVLTVEDRPDTTALDLLKALVAKQSNDMDVLLPTLQMVALQIEVARNKRRETEKKQEIINNYTAEIEACKKAWEKAKTYGIECECMMPADLEFIGQLACFFIVQRTIDNPESEKKKLGNDCFTLIQEASNLFLSLALDKKNPTALYNLENNIIADLSSETKHQTASPIAKIYMPHAQDKKYSLLKSKITQLNGSISTVLRQEWLTVLHKGMVAANSASI